MIAIRWYLVITTSMKAIITSTNKIKNIERTQQNAQIMVGLQTYVGKGKFRLVGGGDLVVRTYGKIFQDQVNKK